MTTEQAKPKQVRFILCRNRKKKHAELQYRSTSLSIYYFPISHYKLTVFTYIPEKSSNGELT